MKLAGFGSPIRLTTTVLDAIVIYIYIIEIQVLKELLKMTHRSGRTGAMTYRSGYLLRPLDESEGFTC